MVQSATTSSWMVTALGLVLSGCSTVSGYLKANEARDWYERGYFSQFYNGGFSKKLPIPEGYRLFEEVRYVGPTGGKFHHEQSQDILAPAQVDQNFKLRPVIIFLHGGSWRAGDKNDMTNVNYNAATQLAAKGFIVANANHRVAPANKIDDMVFDSSALISWWYENAKTYGGRVDQIVLVGYSSGAHLLALGAVASSVKPCAFVGISGLFNPEEFISSTPFTQFALKPTYGEKMNSLHKYSMVNVKIEYFAPTLLLLSRDESLRVRSDNAAFANRLEKMNIKVQVKESNATNHYDQMLIAGQESSSMAELISNFVIESCKSQ